jgi:hypothetical protein
VPNYRPKHEELPNGAPVDKQREEVPSVIVGWRPRVIFEKTIMAQDAKFYFSVQEEFI